MGEAAEQNPSPSHTEQGEITGNPADDQQSPSFSWPVIQFEVTPYRTYHFFNQFRTSSSTTNNFFKGVKWSPDGSCFLTCSDDNNLRVFTLPYDDSANIEGACPSGAENDSYAANLVLEEGETVYDYSWYPYMSASDPNTCVFASTARDHPIHLWDAMSGQLRCTYRAYDAVDEITAAFSVGFNPNGTKIFAGYNKSVRIFDIHRPGRDFEQHSTLQGKKEGQSGIISSIAFSPSVSGMLATGSYDHSTAIYREDNMELLYVLHGQEGGVTHVQFSKDGNYLYSGSRKDPYVLCWDIRMTVGIVYNNYVQWWPDSHITWHNKECEWLIVQLTKLYRSTETTNQRISFDIDHIGKHLATGGQDGLVHVYNLQNGQWVSSFKAASDTVNGISFHPYFPMAATSSGHRRFTKCDDTFQDEFITGPLGNDENCVSIWSFSYHQEDDDMASWEQNDQIVQNSYCNENEISS